MNNLDRKFTSELTITSLDKDCKLWRLEQDLVYHIDYVGSGRYFIVPKGTVTDGATSLFFRAIIPAWGRHGRACVLHDYLCNEAKKGSFRYKDAAKIFLKAMLITDVNKFQAYSMYAAVRVFHGFKYGFNR